MRFLQVKLLFELTLHDARHPTSLTYPAAYLIGNTRQPFRAENDKPDKSQKDPLR